MERWARIKYQPNLPLGENRTYLTNCQEHRQLSREAAAEGMVLLKNEGALLPLKEGCKVVLLGKGTFDYVQGGGGSGEVHSQYRRNIYDGLKTKGERIQIFQPLADYYRDYVENQYSQGILPGFTREPELPAHLLKEAADYADTAIVSICRFSGEGWDRTTADTPDSFPFDNEPAAILSRQLFANGDYCLSLEEQAMVQAAKANFANVIVLLNIGGIMDTSWFRQDEKIRSVLLAMSAGMEGGLAMADILLGDVNPSGRLVDTFAARLEDYPSSANFHESQDYVDYTEDIYVGYRYFETLPGVGEAVCYPFGYGLSYTSFEKTLSEVQLSGDTPADQQITLYVNVINAGELPGKEVVQVYLQAPQGKLDRPARQLIAFAKTRLLAPGETETVTMTFAVASMATFDDLGKVADAAWVLEAGKYAFFLADNVREGLVIPFTYDLEEDSVVSQLTHKLTPKGLARRLRADGTYEVLEMQEVTPGEERIMPVWTDADMEALEPGVRALPAHAFCRPLKKGVIPFFDVAEGKATMDAFLDQLSDQELMHLLGGQPNTGVGITLGMGNMPEYGIPNAITADGPAGIRIEPVTGVHTTCFPCATLLASTWNPGLVREVGAAAAKELKENNMAVWLAPAINIHRSPLCGRNFEYYSEDPLITGIIGSAMVLGIQSQQVSSCVKHFAFNNKETNRKHSDSRVSERAAREIYLKGFEIIVKEADPWMIMSSYNKVNGIHTNQSRELLTDILRQEWGFTGMVTTDWWAYSEQYPEVLAGNDLKMGIGYPDRLQQAMDKGLLKRDDLLICARRILELILRLE